MTNINLDINGKTFEVSAGSTAAMALKLAGVPAKGPQRPLAARFNNELIDLSQELNTPGTLSSVDMSDPEALGILRHSTAHIMAEAVKALFPEVKVTIGPAIESGFYYDFSKPEPFTPDDLTLIENKMKSIAKEGLPFERRVATPLQAVEFFKGENEDYKVELVEDLVRERGVTEVSIYTSGGFADLCRGPHVPSSAWGVAFKLLSVAGAYWRGDENRPMLQRIYGTAFFSKKDLEAHLHLLEEAKKRDHRRLGKELDLFSISDEVGSGLIIWHPKGALLRVTLEEFERQEHLKRGYDIIMGPQILRTELWKRSGHWDNYRDNMYFTNIDEQSYGIKPMNCISHMFVYRSRLRSFRDLPLRFFELGTVQRHEKSGVLHGLTRVRQFTQDDAHLFCTPETLHQEIVNILTMVRDMLGAFNFEYEIELSTRPEKSIGSTESWELATTALENALLEQKAPYEINEGDGAFYGPKIDIKLKDALGRRWQCSTIQCDFTLPERFDLTYVDHDGQKKRPIMLHRTIFGSVERFIGILTEHYAGAFPAWLSPEQIRILTVTSRADEFAKEVQARFLKSGLRISVDLRNEKLGYKIREAQMQKVPFVVVLGDQEVDNKTVSVRKFGGQDLGSMPLDNFLGLAIFETRKPHWD